ncbi:MAG: hypothetical protein LBD52_04620 [Prevotellaceae bacterium]|jgi:predicted nucleic acid-binding protein|nr:hypothetical protein [Prevotellaceae bacterium]
MSNIVVDSGFWLALYDQSDTHYTEAVSIAEYLNAGNIIIPFPTLYESMNTKFMKNNIARKVDYLITFNKKDFIDVCQKRNIEILDK